MNQKERDHFEKLQLKISSVIAEGSFGSLILVYSVTEQKNYALKRIQENYFLNPIDYMKRIDQISFVKPYTYYRLDGYVYMLQDYSPSDLYNCLKLHHNLTEEQLLKLCYEVLISVKEYHRNPPENGQIKPSAFILDRYGRITVSQLCSIEEFKSAQSMPRNYECLLYMAPEFFNGHPIDPIKADIWSLGVTFYFMAAHCYPFFSKDAHTYQKLVLKGNYALQSVQCSLLRSIISKCLDLNPEKRPSIEEMLSLDYFANIKSKPVTNKLPIERRSSQDGRTAGDLIPPRPNFPRIGSPMYQHRLSRTLSLENR
ncbi:STE family protein kinase [Trichomonas vaginalis G3]|uniref:STE family protein kinase n=1 Tax=Trichomonas vaginalis (strain ATCC PRA-98 / G3) TaxID=412133 RepID=A2EEC5_TRIV3|nr:protein serine/threonine kinase protein [Trichomonas vaginalis G3]EAY09023.1 STE family protein kinase [Trichomonas vaginalis G3]KAI5496269.1 protein serine/threonine kinase protein [Trichomonas vaginalis G3]|eukprot:XP_001321246.1 STE family protein kinase [Trichomonas vaginalis G3]